VPSGGATQILSALAVVGTSKGGSSLNRATIQPPVVAVNYVPIAAIEDENLRDRMGHFQSFTNVRYATAD